MELTIKKLKDMVQGMACLKCNQPMKFGRSDTRSSVSVYSHTCGWERPHHKGFFWFTIHCPCGTVTDPSTFGIGGSSNKLTNRIARDMAGFLARTQKPKKVKKSIRRRALVEAG